MTNIIYNFDKVKKEVKTPPGFLENTRLEKTFIQH